MPVTHWGWQVTPEELEQWIVHNDQRVLAVNKPALLVCHPSKHGPWSSLVGACREYLNLPRLHMPFRLDRETSGVVVLAKDQKTGAALQRAVEHRRVCKSYLAIVTGELLEPVEVDAPIGKHPASGILMRRAVTPGGQAAVTRFTPLGSGAGYTLTRAEPLTGRLHQIRVHASHLGHPVAGDKIYGPDETLFLEFLERGFSGRLVSALPLRRQALHCSEAVFEPISDWLPGLGFRAPLAEDIARFCADVMRIDASLY